jgi:hypothetical protein
MPYANRVPTFSGPRRLFKMKKLLTGILAAGIFAVYPAYAQMGMMHGGMHGGMTGQKQSTQKGQMGVKPYGCGMMGGMMSGMHIMSGYGMMEMHYFGKLFYRAENIVDENLKGKVKSLRMQTMEKILREKTEIQIIKMKLFEALKDPNFKESEAKNLSASLEKRESKIRNVLIDALSALRKTIGKENFKKLFSQGMMSGMMMQGGMMSPQQAK